LHHDPGKTAEADKENDLWEQGEKMLRSEKEAVEEVKEPDERLLKAGR
jgi:hypothetical protein